MERSYRLASNSVNDAFGFYKQYNKYCTLHTVIDMCREKFELPCTKMYGIYNEIGLVAIAIATYCTITPSAEAPTGNICLVTELYTTEIMRGRGLASQLLDSIQDDAIRLKCDYICVNSVEDNLYFNNGYELFPRNETRLWKKLSF